MDWALALGGLCWLRKDKNSYVLCLTMLPCKSEVEHCNNKRLCITLGQYFIVMEFEMSRVNRPVFLNPFKIRLPFIALTSISHRISGLLLFLLLPMMLCCMQAVVGDADGYKAHQLWMSTLTGKLLTMVMVASFVFHSLAGLRHILVDVSWFSCELTAARRSCWGVWILFVVLMAGVLWLKW